jgi:hypothetical protein
VGSLADRLSRLEKASPSVEEHSVPMAHRLLFRALERHNAVARGEELPRYTEEEALALYEEDLDVAAGGGTVGALRDSGGWDSEGSRAVLDKEQELARQRVEKGETYG